jgi:hypothetical protein
MRVLRKSWNFLLAVAGAMDYSAFDYTDDRMRRLEREVEQLKDELARTCSTARAVGAESKM